MAASGKTEKATPRRRRLEREKGHIPRSREMGILFNLIALAIIVILFGTFLVKSMTELVLSCYKMIAGNVPAASFVAAGFRKVFVILFPVILIITVFYLLDYALQTRFLFSFKIIQPNFNKLINVKRYFLELFSRKKLVELIKSFLILLLFFVVLYYVLKGKMDMLASAVWFPWGKTLFGVTSILKTTIIALISVSIVLALADYFYQRWEYEQKIKMDRQELKDEMKETEGNPEIKVRRRELMYLILKRDIAKVVPDATVIINNPTHISVALRYKREKDDLPVVLAKGKDELALYIRKIAKENKIPMVEDKPLARALYDNVEVDETIPPELFEAVAAVLRRLIETKQIQI